MGTPKKMPVKNFKLLAVYACWYMEERFICDADCNNCIFDEKPEVIKEAVDKLPLTDLD